MSLGIVNGISLLLLFLSTISSDDSVSKPKVICSFTSESYGRGAFKPEDIDPDLCDYINYDFAVLNDTTYEIDCGNRTVDLDEGYYSRIVALKDKNPNLKVLLCVGGWNDSTEKYSDLVADPNLRSHFVQSTVTFLQKYNFDGLDVAWEYPNCWQGNCGINPEDKGNFVAFLSELRTAFDPESLLLTASVSAVKNEIDQAYDVPSISKLLNNINIMTYDFHGGWEERTGHHAQFFRHPRDTDPSLNVNASVNHWINRGADKSKLIVGIPSYGRSYTLVDPKKSGLYAAAYGSGKAGPETKEGGRLGFNEICHEQSSWPIHEDKRAGTYGVKGNQWVGFDSPKSAVLKARYIQERGLGGASFKNFHTDDYKGSCFGIQFPMLRSIIYGLTSENKKEFESTETDIRAFVEKVQLSILVDENEDMVAKEEKHTGASDDDVFIKLTETETTDSGEVEMKELEVNAGTLDTTGTSDVQTLLQMQIALQEE